MADPILYRKRLIPEECVLLKDDTVLYRDNQIIVTGWNSLNPVKTCITDTPVIIWKRVLK